MQFLHPTLRSPPDAGIEENTYRAYVYGKRTSYAVVASRITGSGHSGGVFVAGGFRVHSETYVLYSFFTLGGESDPAADGLVNVLTKRENEQIIDRKGADADLGTTSVSIIVAEFPAGPQSIPSICSSGRLPRYRARG